MKNIFLFLPIAIKFKKVPSTSYIYSPNPTRRPTTSKITTQKTTTTRSVNRVRTSTKTPQQQKLTTLNVPSTSYIYSPNPITRRPTTQASKPSVSTKVPLKTSTTSQNEKNTSAKPVILINQAVNDADNSYVVISGGGITKHPSPTVHITPKPITNLLTSSTINQLQTKKPPSKQGSSTPKPQFFVSTTQGPFISSSIFYPPNAAESDFHNEGYFAVVTHRPGTGVSSTAIYAVSPGLLQNPIEDTPTIQNEEWSNFPPVRNPNLNMTAAALDESDISTPSFVEDAQLNSKIDLLVNKLIGSMQGNLGNLVDIVYEKKNVSTVETPINTKKNGTSSGKPQKVTTLKPPQKVTSATPAKPVTQKQTKPPAKATTTTPIKKTTTKRTRPTSPITTTKKPKVTSSIATKKPVTRRPTTTTTIAPVEDEEQPVEEEEGTDEGESENAEETVEEGEESNVIDESESESSQPAQESGRIRKREKLFNLFN